jgi:hypothetical protein
MSVQGPMNEAITRIAPMVHARPAAGGLRARRPFRRRAPSTFARAADDPITT